MQKLGSFEVTRRGFDNALNLVGAVILVPGGQAEMVKSSSFDSTIHIHTKHRGFVRVALSHGAALVPVYSFGECHLLDNAKVSGRLARD